MKSRLEILDAVLLVILVLGMIWHSRSSLSGYEIKLATTITIQVGLAVALGFVVGPAGLTSVGHAAFYGLAAYLLAAMAPASAPADLVFNCMRGYFRRGFVCRSGRRGVDPFAWHVFHSDDAGIRSARLPVLP